MNALMSVAAIGTLISMSGCWATPVVIEASKLEPHYTSVPESTDKITHTGTIELQSVSLQVQMLESARPSDSNSSLASEKRARTTFSISINPKTSGIRFAPMNVTLRTNTNETIRPIGYLKEYKWLYSDIYQLSTNTDEVPVSAYADFNVVFAVPYDPDIQYHLTIHGLVDHDVALEVPEIMFVKKTDYRYRPGTVK